MTVLKFCSSYSKPENEARDEGISCKPENSTIPKHLAENHATEKEVFYIFIFITNQN